MSQLHFTDASVANRPARLAATGSDSLSDTVDIGDSPELVDGTPFILGDDGSCDLQLNRFFRECLSIGVRSANSVRAYARDLLTWVRFLSSRREGESVWEADRQDVIADHSARRLVAGPDQIAGASLNLFITNME